MDERTRVEIQEGIVFGTGGDRSLRCDVYRPPAAMDPPARGWPAVLLLHGGAWHTGDRTQLRGYGILLGRAGYVCVASEYRLSPEARWPEHLHDTKTAIRWMRANATALAIDRDRIAVHGNSAGGHLALVAAGTPDIIDLEGEGGSAGVHSGVRACIAIYAPTALWGEGGDGVPRPIALLTDDPSEEIARQASPVTWARPGFPPTLLIHGASDKVVPVASSQMMFDALQKAGVPVELHIYPDQEHAFDTDPRFGRRTAAEILFFLERYLHEAAPAPGTTTAATAAGSAPR